MMPYRPQTQASPDGLELLLPPNCPDPTLDTWDRHSSIAFTTATKGLRNAPGENNCFVNSAVQVFWHLDVFRRSYRRLSGHTCMGNSCIFCALKVIFTQFQFSDQASLHPDALRKALADTFANQQRFQLGHMDDAAECFENILRRIHYHIANSCSEDSCTAPHCLPHRKFSLNIMEKVMCPCGASSSPLKFSEMVHYISAKALVSQAQVMQETGDVLHPDRFGLLLRNANAMGDIRECPGNCGKTVQIRRTLLNVPDVVSIGLVWDSDHPSVETTTEVASNIGTTILLQDVFHAVMQDVHALPRLQLVGLVCYYGKHYSTFVFHSKLRVWVYFDDATVREIGPHWKNVVDKCSKGRYQPLLLLYANPAASPVSVETAPRKRTMAPGFAIPGGPEEESSLDRTQDSISSQQLNQQRSQTPNPEPPHFQQDVNPRARSVTPSALDTSDHRRQQSFIMAMGTKGCEWSLSKQPPVRMVGGQAGTVKGQHMQAGYSDYTLSTSDQYRRPVINGIDQPPLPLPPNLKGYAGGDSQRRDSFNKRGREAMRADVIRSPLDSQGHAEPQVVGSYTQAYNGQGGQMQPPLNCRSRSLSQGGEDTSSTSSQEGQHTILKPMADPQPAYSSGYYGGALPHSSHSSSHTPVQSGLATLPRKKKDSSQHQQQKQLEATTSFGRQNCGGNLSTRPPPVPLPGTQHHLLQNQQQEMLSELDKKSASGKKFKREQRKADKHMKSSSVSSYSRSEQASPSPSSSTSEEAIPTPQPLTRPHSTTGAPFHHSKGQHSSSQRLEESHADKLRYIDRKVVESVLKQQGFQRQSSASSGSTTPTVEMDSIMGRLLATKLGEATTSTGAQLGDASLDNVSLSSHKDSGYGGSDRNSSSSTGSGTIDPCTQYFISKSMVVPRTLNTQFLQQQQMPAQEQMMSDFTDAKVTTSNLGHGDIPSSEIGRHVYQALTQRKIMHPIKESSQEDILKLVSRNQTPSPPPLPPGPPPMEDLEQDRRRGSGKGPPPIPPKNFAAFQVSKSSHNREASLDSLDTTEVQNDYFVSMCAKADDLMDRCILAETQEDLRASLRFCDGALGCLKEAMNQSDIASKALAYAQKKHNSCLLKSRSLFKRSQALNAKDGSGPQAGKRSSITSTDSDNSDRSTRRGPPPDVHARANNASHQGSLPVSISGSRRQQHQQYIPQSSAAPQLSQTSTSSSPSPAMFYVPSSSPQASHHQSGSFSKLPPPVPAYASQYQPAASSSNVSSNPHLEPNHSRSGSNISVRSSNSVSSSMSPAQSHYMGKNAHHCEAGIDSASPNSSAAGYQSVSHASQYVNNAPVPLDAYGTLPRNRKNRRVSDPNTNSEVYQLYLDRQKSQQQGSGWENDKPQGQNCTRAPAVRQSPSPSFSQGSLSESAGSRVSQSSQSSTLSASSSQLSYQLDLNSPHPQQHKQNPQNNSSHPSVQQTHIPSAFSSPHMPQTNTSSSLQSSQTLGYSHQQHQAQPNSQQNFNYPYQQQTQPLQGREHSHHPYPQQMSRPSSSHHTLIPDHRNTSNSSGDLSRQHSPSSMAVSGYTQPLPGQHQSLKPNINYAVNNQNNYSFINKNASHDNSNTRFDVNKMHTKDNESSSSVRYNDLNNCNNKSNLSSNRGGYQQGNPGPPPRPPARTSSNPDFAPALTAEPSLPPPRTSSTAHPLSHSLGATKDSPLNYPVQPRRGASPFSSAPLQPPQLKHAASTTGLNDPLSAPAFRPLERCSSQPDVQHMDMTSSYLDVSPPSMKHDSDYLVVSNNFNVMVQKPIIPRATELDLNSTNSDTESSKPNVRALASHFDALKPSNTNRNDANSSTPSMRTRSKSESGGSKKPKSVLKSKKNKAGKVPRKSVTFAEEVSNSGYQSAAEELTSFSAGLVDGAAQKRQCFSDDEETLTDFVPTASRKLTLSVGPNLVAPLPPPPEASSAVPEFDDGSSNSDETPSEEMACQLCRKREMVPGSAYCGKCDFYMRKLVS